MSRTEAILDRRAALVARWYGLTREVLPAMAATHRRPIRLDHCFMRVCLDEALGAPWTAIIARPAVRKMSDGQLRRAINVAEGIAVDPRRLVSLNEKSLSGRRVSRVAAARPCSTIAGVPL